MGRILSIDYGTKRVGLAVTDPLQIAANPLDTIPTSHIFEYIDNYLQKEKVDKIVLGYPMQTNGRESETMQPVQKFAAELRNKYPLTELIFVDERYTSVLAQRTMLEAGLKKKDRQNKSTVDKIAAVIILQSYMESRL